MSWRAAVRRATVGLGLVGLLLGGGSGAQTATNPYPNMAPLAQYLSPSQEAEIALARSAAPPSISAEAEILAFGPKGYETAVKGKEPFCLYRRTGLVQQLRQARLLEPESPSAALFQPGGSALGAARLPEANRMGAGGAVAPGDA